MVLDPVLHPHFSTISLSLTQTVPFPLYWPFSRASVQLLRLCDRNSGKNGQNCSTCTPWQDLQRSGNRWPLWGARKWHLLAWNEWTVTWRRQIFWSHEKEMSGRKPELVPEVVLDVGEGQRIYHKILSISKASRGFSMWEKENYLGLGINPSVRDFLLATRWRQAVS